MSLNNKASVPSNLKGCAKFSMEILETDPKASVFSQNFSGIMAGKLSTTQTLDDSRLNTEMIRPRLKKDDAWNMMMDLGYAESNLNVFNGSDWKAKEFQLEKFFEFCGENLTRINSKNLWEGVVTVISTSMKEFKESNVLMVKGVIEFFINLLSRIPGKWCGKCGYLISMLIYEKIGDLKFQSKIKELADLIVEKISKKIFF